MNQLLGMTLDEVAAELSELGEPRFRARQLFDWVYHRLETDFGRMTNLPPRLRGELAERYDPLVVHPVHTLSTDGGRTEKALLELAPPALRLLESPLGERRRLYNTVEAVLMDYPGPRSRRTVCVSSQAGCAMACTFCATGQSGFVRDLTAGEIVGQVLHFARRVRDANGPKARPTNLVFMGQGEPFANFENVWRAVELLHAPEAFGLGARHITLSTVGVVPRIRELAGKPLQVNLAVSLHAPDDVLRDRLVPLNRRYPLDEVLDACGEYVALTRRRVSFEYACIRDVNDSTEQAIALAEKVRGILCHVNLIPLNAGLDPRFQAPEPGRVEAMAAALNTRGVPTTIRDTRGREIDAACGQLRARLLQTA
ncbi:MAG TPA: 23S rRNA (adenine(2503)-C(2))-methyltransferase RlmN [Chloroflexota bacterium]